MAIEDQRITVAQNDQPSANSAPTLATGRELMNDQAYSAENPAPARETAQANQPDPQAQAGSVAASRVEITPDESHVAHLPAGAAIDDIRVEGANLVLVQADGTEITIVGGALHIPTFLIGDVALPQQAVIAALEQSGVNVAAGPDGSYHATGGADGGHGNFQDADAQGLGELGQLASLLSNTDQADETQVRAEETFNGVPLILPSTTGVYTELGSDAGVFEQGSVTGVFGFDGGKDTGVITSIAFANASNVEEGTSSATTMTLTSGGAHVSIAVDGLTITGTAAGQVVFTLTVDKVTGAYTYTQFLPLDHPDKGEAGADDIIRMQFTYTVTDKNNDAVTGTASIDIRDDAPVAHDVTPSTALSDAAQAPGESEGSESATPISFVSGETGALFHAGADGVKSITFTTPEGLKAIGLDEDGKIIQEDLRYVTGTDEAGSTVLTAFGATSGQVVFTLIVSSDGSYSFETSASFAHSATDGTGDVLPISIGYTVTDGDGDNATGTLTIDIQDDIPTASNVTGSMSENDTAQIVLNAGVDYTFGADKGTISFGEASVTDGPSGVKLGAPQIFIGKDGHSLSIVAGTAFDALAKGETAVIHIPYTVTDGDGDAVTKDIAVTVTGSNDDAVIFLRGDTTDANAATVTEDSGSVAHATETASGTLSFNDVDVTDKHVVSSVTSSEGALGSLTASVSQDTTNGQGGVISWNYSVDNAEIQSLAEGEERVETFTVTLSDGTSTVTETVTITIKGTNDAPIAVAQTGSVVEDDEKSDVTGSFLNGATDVDHGAVLSVATVNGQSDGASGVDGAFGRLTWDAASGTYSYALDNSKAAVQALASGESVTETFSFTITDEHNATSTQTLTIIVQGTNDAPVLTGDLAATVEKGQGYTLTTADLYFSDPDDTSVTFTVSNLVHGTILVDGVASTTFTSAQLAEGKVTFVQDGTNATSASFQVIVEDGNEDNSTPVPGTFNVSVTGTDLPPVVEHWNVITNAAVGDTISIPAAALLWTAFDPNGHSLAITAVTGAALAGDTITYQIPSGAGSFGYSVSDGTEVTNATATVSHAWNTTGTSANEIFIAHQSGDGYSVTGGLGNDVLIGSADTAKNVLYGDGLTETAQDGNDLLIGGVNSTNMMYGGGGNDVIIGATHAYNHMDGGSGNDTIVGAAYASNEMLGGSGNDTLIGGDFATNTMDGGSGNDIFEGGLYSFNVMDGGAGDDTFRLIQSSFNTVVGGEGKDILDFSRFDHGIEITLVQSDTVTHFDISGGGLEYSGIEGVVGTHFDDVIIGSDFADTLFGGDGNDVLVGGGGDDMIYGGAGMNTMTGGTGADTFFIDESALSKLDPADVITDFNPSGEGDKLDVSSLINALISQSGLSTDEALGKLSAVVNDATSETTISINTGSESHAVVTLQNYTPGTEAIKILFDHSEHAITTAHTSGA